MATSTPNVPRLVRLDLTRVGQRIVEVNLETGLVRLLTQLSRIKEGESVDVEWCGRTVSYPVSRLVTRPTGGTLLRRKSTPVHCLLDTPDNRAILVTWLERSGLPLAAKSVEILRPAVAIPAQADSEPLPEPAHEALSLDERRAGPDRRLSRRSPYRPRGRRFADCGNA